MTRLFIVQFDTSKDFQRRFSTHYYKAARSQFVEYQNGHVRAVNCSTPSWVTSTSQCSSIWNNLTTNCFTGHNFPAVCKLHCLKGQGSRGHRRPKEDRPCVLDFSPFTSSEVEGFKKIQSSIQLKGKSRLDWSKLPSPISRSEFPLFFDCPMFHHKRGQPSQYTYTCSQV